MRTRAAQVVGIAISLGLPFGIDPGVNAQALPTSAKLDTQPLRLTPPDRYQVPSALVAARSVTLIAPADGIVRSQEARAGASARPNQEVAKLDNTEALALLKIARAEVRECEAAVGLARAGEGAGTGPAGNARIAQAQARLEAAQARVELAQIAVDRCILRAPFGGRIIASNVSDGQFVTKGTVIAELADVSSLRALVPVARGGVAPGGGLELTVDGNPVTGRVQALVPLGEEHAVLRELAAPLTCAWVVIANSNGALEPGQRVMSPDLPVSPLAVVPSLAIKQGERRGGPPLVQVIRNEYVADVPVKVLGNVAPERVQITGLLRPTDALIVSSSVPLLPGTLVRFGGGGAGSMEGVTPNPSALGETAEVQTPRPAGRGPAPIGAPGSAAPRVGPAGAPAQPPPATKPAANAPPF